MLRRPATVIKLTPEDVLEYDDSLMSKEAHSHDGNSQVQQNQEHMLQEQINNSSELIQDYKETRDERIGVNRNN